MNKIIELSNNEIVTISGGMDLEPIKIIGKNIAIAATFGAGIGFIYGYISLGGLLKEVNRGIAEGRFGLEGGRAGGVAGAILFGGTVAIIETFHVAKKWLSGELDNSLEKK